MKRTKLSWSTTNHPGMRNVAETTVWWTQGYIRGCYKTFIEEEVIIFRELTVE